MDIHLLAIQARILLWTAFGWIALGLWLGTDPLTLAWRAAVGAVVAMVVGGWLLRRVAEVINEQIATEMAQRQMAAEQAAQPPPAEARRAPGQRPPPPGRAPGPAQGSAR